MKVGQIKNGLRADNEFWNCIDINQNKVLTDKLNCKFLLIKYTKDGNRNEPFLQFLIDSIPNYVLKKEDRKNPERPHNWAIFCRKANEKFVKDTKTGEIGELILFHLLELDKSAIQIVNKMNLKTSGGHHYHGIDAVHFGIEGSDKILYLGSSKTDNEFSDALNLSLTELETFDKDEKKSFEINLATGNMSDYLSKPLREEIKKYLLSQQPDMSNYVEVFAIFIGYNYVWLKKYEDEGLSGTELTDKVVEKYKKDIEKYIDSVQTKINDSKLLKNKRFIFYILPLKELQELKKKFVNSIK